MRQFTEECGSWCKRGWNTKIYFLSISHLYAHLMDEQMIKRNRGSSWSCKRCQKGVIQNWHNLICCVNLGSETEYIFLSPKPEERWCATKLQNYWFRKTVVF